MSESVRIGSKIKALRKEIGLSQADFGTKLGVGVQTVVRIEAGGREPKAPLIARIAEIEPRLNLNWLLGHDPEMFRSDRAPAPRAKGSAEHSPALVMIPEYAVQVSAGGGLIVNGEHEVTAWPFREDYFRREIGLPPEKIAMVRVRGDSMIPELMPNQPIAVNIAEGQQWADGIWVIRFEDSVIVKRVQKLPGRKLRVSSDNVAYPPFEVDTSVEQPDFALIGRVVWTARML